MTDTTETPMTETQVTDTQVTEMDATPELVEEKNDKKVGDYSGFVKWFSSPVGYGFITVISEGELKGKDIFCHHTGVCPVNSKFRTLVKGEYINFDLEDGQSGIQAVNITGIGGGALMCDNNINYGRVVPTNTRSSRPQSHQQPNQSHQQPNLTPQQNANLYQQASQYQFATTTMHPSFPAQYVGQSYGNGYMKRPRP
jgi:CspA family cold shock protein